MDHPRQRSELTEGAAMRAYESEATIERSADEVWSYAADIERHPEWMSVAEARVLHGDGAQVGARGRERIVLGPFKWDVEFEVSEAVPGRRIVWRAADDPHGAFEVGLDLDATGPTTTHARYHGGLRLRGRWRLLAPLVAMEGAAGVRRELGRLKENLERTAAAVLAHE
jgi:uncharacterized protein YndB with AHSA1/START domain